MTSKKTADSFVSPALRITPKRAGWRRAGRAWPSTPTDVAAGSLSAQQVAQVQADPMLVVEEIPVPQVTTAAEGKPSRSEPSQGTSR